MKTEKGDFVFQDSGNCYGGGLTKREYFAALAMQGILAGGSIASDTKAASIKSVAMADALIKELNKDLK